MILNVVIVKTIISFFNIIFNYGVRMTPIINKCDDCHPFLMKNKKETGHDEGWYAVCDSCYHIKTEHAS
jgi:hypothetical protein